MIRRQEDLHGLAGQRFGREREDIAQDRATRVVETQHAVGHPLARCRFGHHGLYRLGMTLR
ncbi:hypothetical protein [Thiocapsa rosea]|uniref:hypothetical protein n=1 Tax=Thiocapsa rosea TaxID=69360 RepID=UPI0011C430E8|nr:hypothetical protein [Thiocapsa rosea]